MRWLTMAMAMSLWACGGAREAGPSDAGAGILGAKSDAGSSDPGEVDAGNADGGADAGLSADCVGLIPSTINPPVTYDVPNSAGMTCTATTSDGKGVVIAEAHDAGVTPGLGDQVTWNIFDIRGQWQGNFRGGPSVLPQAAGFEGGVPGLAMRWDEFGNPIAFVALQWPSVVGPADGGVVAFESASGMTAHRIDANGNDGATATASIPSGFTPLAGAEDSSGAAVAVYEAAGRASFVWFDFRSGTSGAPGNFSTDAQSAVARPLIGGGVAVRLDAHWTGVVSPGSSSVAPAPSWLPDGSDFTIVLSGRGYAVWKPGSNAISIVSAQGNSCGPMTFSGMNALSVGADGTVIGSMNCSKVSWRAALK